MRARPDAKLSDCTQPARSFSFLRREVANVKKGNLKWISRVYSYTWGSITGPREIDHRAVIQWFREQGIRSIELYDPWIKDTDEIKVITDALAEAEMRPCICDVECHVVSRDPDLRKASAEKFHQRLAVARELGRRGRADPSIPSCLGH